MSSSHFPSPTSTQGSLRVGGVHFREFPGEELPGSWLSQAQLNFSQFGVAYTTGPAKKQRRIWAVSAYADAAKVQSILSVFESWDNSRQISGVATVTVVDSLLSSYSGSSKTTQAFFTTPPTVSKVSSGGGGLFIVSFGLTEVS